MLVPIREVAVRCHEPVAETVDRAMRRGAIKAAWSGEPAVDESVAAALVDEFEQRRLAELPVGG